MQISNQQDEDLLTEKEIEPPVASWKLVKKVDAYDSINRSVEYRAGLYDTSAE